MMQVLLEPPKGYTKKVLNYGPYSPSRLIAGKCPARFFAQYVRKDKIVSHSVASARGTAIHEILEKITKSMQAGALLTTKQVNEWVTESVGKHPAAYAQIDLIKEAADAYVRTPSPYINITTECEKAIAVELWVEDTWDDTSAPKIAFVSVPYILPDGRTNPDCFFGGKLDQHTVDHQTRTVTILDHKSTPSANEKEDHTFQVGAYAWLTGLFYPGYTIKTVIHYAHPRLSFISSPVYWYEQDMDVMQHEILIKIGALESYQSFEALPGNQCDYCHIVQECTVYEKVREQKTKGTIDLNTHSVEDLIRLGKELYVVDQMATQLQKALKEGIDKLCPINGINIGGVSYGYKKSEGVDWEATNKKIGEESRRAQGKGESQSYESEEDRRWCEEIASHKDIDSILLKHQVNPNLFKTYNGTKMKSIWKFDKPELMETLKKVVVIDGSTRFGTSKD